MGKSLLFVGSWIFLSSLYAIIFAKYPHNSDNAAYVLQALDITKGNVFLNGWTLSRDNFFSLDTILYSIGILLGLDPKKLMFIVPAVIYSTLIISLIYLISSLTGIRKSFISVAAFLAFPLGMDMDFASMGADHNLTYVFIIITLFLMIKNELSFFEKTSAIILLSMAEFGDPLTYIVGGIPILLTALYCNYKDIDRTKKQSIIRIVFASVLLVQIAKLLVRSFGGFHSTGYGSSFADLDKISHNIYLLIKGLIDIFNMNFFGNAILYLPTTIAFMHALFFCFFIFFLYLITRKKISFIYYDSEIFVMYFSVLSTLLLTISFILSSIPVDFFSCHYLIFTLINAAIIFAVTTNRIGEYEQFHNFLKKSNIIIERILAMILDSIGIDTKRLFQAKEFNFLNFCFLKKIAVIFVIVFAVNFFIDSFKDFHVFPYTEEKNVIHYIEKEKLTHGFSPYWNANILTVLSSGKIKSRAVLYDGNFIAPYHWLSKNTWYCFSNDPFFVIYAPNDFGINEQTIFKTFGFPTKIKSIGPYRIYSYRSDIHPMCR